MYNLAQLIIWQIHGNYFSRALDRTGRSVHCQGTTHARGASARGG